LDKYDFGKVSLYDTLDSHDCRIVHVKRKLEVLKADETTADLLNVDISDPLFYFHTVGTTKNDIKIEYSIAKYRGDNNSFEIYIDR
jgi:GntR family transcriptional regulator